MGDFGSPKFANVCRIGMKWRIKENDLKDALQGTDSLQSESFHASKIPGITYYIVIKSSEQHSNYIFVYLNLNFKMTNNIHANFTIFVKSALFNTKVEQLFEKSAGYGNKLCSREELFNPGKKFFINGIMEIELEGTLKAQGLKRKASESLSLSHILWCNDDEKDITIHVKDQEIKVHKWILSSKSPVFKAELGSGLLETEEKIINISDFDFNTVEIVIKYFYEFEIKDFFNEINAIDLLRFADKYDIKPFHDLIQEFMIKELSEENVVEFSNASVTFNAAELKEFCICFLMTFVGNTTIIKNANKLKPEILQEIGRRSLFIVFS